MDSSRSICRLEFSTAVLGQNDPRQNQIIDQQGKEMKSLLIIIGAVFVMGTVSAAETKRVCHTDPKTKKEVCKNVKIHKKLEGTPVPAKK
jgi:hypothetical protein